MAVKEELKKIKNIKKLKKRDVILIIVFLILLILAVFRNHIFVSLNNYHLAEIVGVAHGEMFDLTIHDDRGLLILHIDVEDAQNEGENIEEFNFEKGIEVIGTIQGEDSMFAVKENNVLTTEQTDEDGNLIYVDWTIECEEKFSEEIIEANFEIMWEQDGEEKKEELVYKKL